MSLEAFMVNFVWAAAMQWLMINPQDPASWETNRLVHAMGGLPE